MAASDEMHQMVIDRGQGWYMPGPRNPGSPFRYLQATTLRHPEEWQILGARRPRSEPELHPVESASR